MPSYEIFQSISVMVKAAVDRSKRRMSVRKWTHN